MANLVRIEEDLIGTMEVPKDAYYGIQTLRAVENFPITGYTIYKELIIALAIVKKSAAIANMETGQLPSDMGKAIVQACDEIIEGKLHDQFITDPIQGGAGTSVNMNANEVIANRAIEIMGGEKGNYKLISPNTHVNMSQSTNDAFPTAARLAVLVMLDRLIETTTVLSDAFQAKADEFDHVIKMGRTHLQDAVPIRLGQEFAAYSRVLKRDVRRMEQTKQALHEVNMGATAVGTGLNADPDYIQKVTESLCEFSNYPLVHAENLVDATQNTDVFTEVSSALKICMTNMSKIANDLRLMASGPRAGLGEIGLPPRQPGSSIMPGKVNPVMCEVVNQVAFQVIGNDHSVTMASEAGQFELNVMEPVMIFNVMQSLTIMNNVFRSFQKNCLEGIVANEERCQQYVDNSVGIITALNPHLGYEVVSKIAKEAIQTGRPVREICLEKGVLSEERLNEILNPFEMTSPGIAGGKN